MTENKAILLIGRSGRGKSTLANVVTGTNKFEESSGSISKTKKVQSDIFRDEKNENYLIIDTPGIGDTKMSDSEVLDIVAEAVYRAKDGVGQVFFVTNGRFDQYEMATYDLLRTIIFDSDITKHTTIVRTRFDKFKKKEACQADINLMIKEAKETKDGLEQDIIAKEKELAILKEGQKTILRDQIKGKESELGQLIFSVKDKLKSNSFLDSKRKERNKKLEFFFKDFPADQDKFVKGLENIKQGLGKKLA